MAKKIKGVKLKEADIHKNSGKEISHTISKIKENERFYTILLVLVFMVTISVSIYIGLRVNLSSLSADELSTYASGFSYSGQLIHLDSTNIGMENAKTYTISSSNFTSDDINYLMKIVLDQHFIKECRCEDMIASYDQIHFSFEDKEVRSFSNSDLVLKTGFLPRGKKDSLRVSIWLDESVDTNVHFYGRIEINEL